MKNDLVKKVSGFAMALALTAGLTACGNSVEGGTAVEVPQGQVVKGIVVGATVKDGKGNVLIQSTLGEGKFPLSAAGPYTTTGGTYKDMTGTTRPAPQLSAEEGSINITPMTTLYNNATPAVAAQLDALCKSAGIAPDSVFTGTVPTDPALAAFVKLNETIGEVLTQAGANSTPAYLQSLATVIATDVKKMDAASTSSATLLTTIVKVTPPAGVTLNNTAITAISNATTPGATIPAPPPVTGTTGTTGGSTGGTSAK